MPTPSPLFQFLEYSAARVEAALAAGTAPHFEVALPTWYDAFFTLWDRLGLLHAIEALPDPRHKPYIPLPLLMMLTICRFLHCHKSFRRVGASGERPHRRSSTFPRSRCPCATSAM